MKQNDSSNYDLFIKAGQTEGNYWKDLWRYRDLFYILTWRDLKVRYKQTVLGVAWAVVRPLLTMIIFTVVFSGVAGLPSEGNAPYAVMVYVGLLPWQFFANALAESSNSLVSSANLISKVYFPRLIIPTASIITACVDFLISFVLLLLLMVVYQYVPSWKIVFLPFFLLVAFLAAFGVGLLLTAMNVKYRDFRYIIPFIIQFGVYISPVGFSSNIVYKKLGEKMIAMDMAWLTDYLVALYAVNPMVGVIDGFRWSIIGNAEMNWSMFGVSICMCLLILAYAIYYFRKMEKTFADVI
ncbi:MAG: phosphate ABC transporter permease [Flexibacter sp. CG_4_10_14_3_um_filter_32_15]|nr:MAG: phosphate ABC transporter permease [Flexibacter sp. CG_4_10_14_3_um_filter_32_15]